MSARGDLTAGTLETERLVLEPVGREHAPELWAAIEPSLPELRPWMPWAVDASLAETTAFTLTAEVDRGEGRGFHFAIRPRDDGVVAGVIGLTVDLPARRTAELGYWVRTDRTRRGYVTEAARAVLEFGFRDLDLVRIEVNAGVDNLPSRRVIEKLGFRPEGTRRHAGWGAGGAHDIVMHGLLREEAAP